MVIEERGRAGIAIAHDARQRPARPFVVHDLLESRDFDPPKPIPVGIGGRDTTRERVEEAVTGDDHQAPRGPRRLEGPRRCEPRGRDMPHWLLEEHETDVKNARIEALERTPFGRGAGGVEGWKARCDTGLQVDRSRAVGLRVTKALMNGRSPPAVGAVQ